MEVNRSVHVVDDNVTDARYVDKVNGAFTASCDDSALDVNVIDIEVACTDTVCKNEVVCYRYILEHNILASDDNGAEIGHGRIFTGFAYVCSEDVMEELSNFVSSHIVSGKKCAVFVTLDIALFSHTDDCFLCPGVNISLVRELIEDFFIVAADEKHSRECEEDILSSHIRVGCEGRIACTDHYAHLYCAGNGFVEPVIFCNVFKVGDICHCCSTEGSCDNSRKLCSCYIICGRNCGVCGTYEQSVIDRRCHSLFGPVIGEVGKVACAYCKAGYRKGLHEHCYYHNQCQHSSCSCHCFVPLYMCIFINRRKR